MKGGTTSTHLENKHKGVYFWSIQLYQLWREHISELDEPFSLESWISFLVDWIVADDQVSPIDSFLAMMAHFCEHNKISSLEVVNIKDAGAH